LSLQMSGPCRSSSKISCKKWLINNLKESSNMMLRWNNSSHNMVFRKHFMLLLQQLRFLPTFGTRSKISRRRVAMEMYRVWSRDFLQLEITTCKWFNRSKRSLRKKRLLTISNAKSSNKSGPACLHLHWAKTLNINSKTLWARLKSPKTLTNRSKKSLEFMVSSLSY
jgi:hypothetical protein